MDLCKAKEYVKEYMCSKRGVTERIVSIATPASVFSTHCGEGGALSDVHIINGPLMIYPNGHGSSVNGATLRPNE